MTRFQPLRLLLCLLLLLCCRAAVAAETPSGADAGFGVLVMAHGGPAEWNEGVLAAVEPLRGRYPLEVAFGMADACSLQEAASRLEAKGARRIGVVRLFVSGESWYERTGQILGLREGAPALAGGALPPACTHEGHGEHGAAHRMELFRIDSEASFVLSREGLLDAPEMGTILVERARGLSRDAAREDVLVLAHGPADDAENERWLAALDARAEAIRASMPFHRVEVETLREDWPEKREAAEVRVRAFVARAEAEGRRAIVVPYRLFGFGPFAKVLDGHTYLSDGKGLLPHPAVTRWIERQADALRAGGFQARHGEPAAPGSP